MKTRVDDGEQDLIAEVAERQALVQQELSILELPNCGGAPLLALLVMPTLV